MIFQKDGHNFFLIEKSLKKNDKRQFLYRFVMPDSLYFSVAEQQREGSILEGFFLRVKKVQRKFLLAGHFSCISE